MSVTSPTEQQIADLLAYIKSGIEAGTDFAKEQAPDVAQQIIAWGVWASSIWIGVAAILLLLAVVALIVSVKAKFDDVGFAAFAFALCLGFIGVVVAVGNILSLIKILVAPKLYLIEWITSRI